jgi:hypothetical protein
MYAGAAAFWLAEEKKLKRWAVLGGSAGLRRTVVAFAAARGVTVVEDVSQAEAMWVGLPGTSGELAVLEPEAGVAPTPEAAASGVRPLMWHQTLEKYSARELNNRHRRRFDQPLDGASWSAWAALKLVGEALLRQGPTPQALVEYLESEPPFDGHKGRALTFRKADHQLLQPMYLWRPGKPGAEAGEVVAEVPRGGGDLDAIFLPAGDGCLKS